MKQLINKELIDKITLIKKLSDETSTNNNTSQKAYKLLSHIYPLSSKRRLTGLSFREQYNKNYELVISKGINTLYSKYGGNSNEIRDDEWIEFVLNNDDYIKLAEHIPTKVKKDLFLKIHKSLKGITNDNFKHKITRKVKHKLFYVRYRDVKEIEIESISYNGYRMAMLVKGDEKEQSFDVAYDVTFSEIVHQYGNDIIEMIDEWNVQKEKESVTNNIKLENAKKIVRPFMVMNKIKEM